MIRFIDGEIQSGRLVRHRRNAAGELGGQAVLDGTVGLAVHRMTFRPLLPIAQIDWIPLSVDSVRPTQGKTLALMQVLSGSQSFNAINQLRVLSRWMRMITVPNQSSVAEAFQEFDADGRMKPSSCYDLTASRLFPHLSK